MNITSEGSDTLWTAPARVSYTSVLFICSAKPSRKQCTLTKNLAPFYVLF